jgi:hypothetical protein
MALKTKKIGNQEVTLVKTPLVIMFLNDDNKLVCHIHPPSDYTYEHYGLITCDLVRHIAMMFGVHEDAVWEWVDKERKRHTTNLETVHEAFSTTTRN